MKKPSIVYIKDNNRYFLYTILVVLSCISLSCDRIFNSRKVREDVVVNVGDAVLYRDDVSKIMPKNTLPNDSMQIADRIVDSWIREQVLLKKAKENTSGADEYFARQIEQYKNSLIIYTYQNQVLNRFLDTIVSEEEIEEYYNNNITQFYLKSNIVKVKFVKIDKGSRQLAKIRKEIFAEPFREDNMKSLVDLCSKFADNYYLEEDQWLFFNDLLKEVPIQTYNQEDFLKNNRNIEISSDDYIYYVVISDFKVRDMISPLKFETERIRQIILNYRKQLVLKTMQSDLMQEAKNKNWIKYKK